MATTIAEVPATQSTSQPVSQPVNRAVRLTSMDAYRGFVMFLMVAEVLHLSRVAAAHPNWFWQFLAKHQTHVEWYGASLHDLIQPSFSFLVGVALPYSIASRAAKGESKPTMFRHAAWRALILILLGVFLRSVGKLQTNWTFEDTLSQIGMGYLFLFALGFCSIRTIWISLALVLVGYWLAFVLYPLPPAGFDYTAVGVAADWPYHASGIAAHFNKNSNLAWRFDIWFLNLFRREKPFTNNGGGYATLSFIPTLGTMILGLIAGRWLKSDLTEKAKIQKLLIAGIACLALGLILHYSGICPSVKRIWTPSWTIFSGGWCLLLLAGFYGVIDVAGYRRWAFPLVVIGMNSIAIYVLAHLIDRFIIASFKIHFSPNVFNVFGEGYSWLLSGWAVIIVFWLMLYWMYKRKLFIRI